MAGYENYLVSENGRSVVVKVIWREPLFVSPFSSRYDATYGRPLYNITSMDFSFTLQNLGNMIRVANLTRDASLGAGNAIASRHITAYDVNISAARLCYQVMTIPPILQKPLTTLVPYRRFVPYITDYNQGLRSEAETQIPVNGAKISITSGVYTLNEMPTAIWIYCAPTKSDLQNNAPDIYPYPVVGEAGPQNNVNISDNWDSNKLFGYIQHVNISMANTTQILNTADIPDLYRIAKANGCEDSYWSWAAYDAICPTRTSVHKAVEGRASRSPYVSPMYYGAGSVLRLKPGVDLIVPDQALIPGANANNMVFQVIADFYIPPHSATRSRYSLWLLFEYVGVAAISPGQCEITMNPLGSGEIMAVSPVMSATSEVSEGNLEGSGFWDKMKRNAGIAGRIADKQIISQILNEIPEAKGVGKYLEKHGFGAPACKRGRGGESGGAVMGKGLNDWV
jgi:hypothetical protein